MQKQRVNNEIQTKRIKRMRMNRMKKRTFKRQCQLLYGILGAKKAEIMYWKCSDVFICCLFYFHMFVHIVFLFANHIRFDLICLPLHTYDDYFRFLRPIFSSFFFSSFFLSVRLGSIKIKSMGYRLFARFHSVIRVKKCNRLKHTPSTTICYAMWSNIL